VLGEGVGPESAAAPAAVRVTTVFDGPEDDAGRVLLLGSAEVEVAGGWPLERN
jgi:hypothetical protein